MFPSGRTLLQNCITSYSPLCLDPFIYSLAHRKCSIKTPELMKCISYEKQKEFFQDPSTAPAEICRSRPSSCQTQSLLVLYHPVRQVPNLFTPSEQIFIAQKSSHYLGDLENLTEILQTNKYYPEIQTCQI